MRKVILDTNFLVYCVEFHIDIDGELDRLCDFMYEVCIIDKTLNELKSLESEDESTRIASKIAQKLVENYKIIETDKKKHVDDLILENTNKNDILASMDKKLRVKFPGMKIIIRQMNHLTFED